MNALDAVERSLGIVDEWEPIVRAWTFLDPDRARAEARTRSTEPFAGVVLGVKDIFDTGDQPTEYGSPIYAGFRPRGDAAVVAQLRAAGATVLGKTVTTEFACFEPRGTTNPHRPTHTPGGSSSGSAAAVATGMVDIALGTQTAGSVIRPASFCGVLGFKPTFGTVATAGVKPVAPSLDTVGWFARDVGLLDRVRVALTARPPMAPRRTAPRVAVVRTEQWDDADDDARAALDEAVRLSAVAGAAVAERALPPLFAELAAAQPIVMAHEAARSLSWERSGHPAQLSTNLTRLLDAGMATDPREYDDLLDRTIAARADVDELFGDDDVLMTLAADGEAPEGLAHTGDPRFARLWTLLGVPTLSVPGLTGGTGLPIGIQLVARHRADAKLLAAGAWLARVLPAPCGPRQPAAT